MKAEDLKNFTEITNSATSPGDIHPLKLDRWWKSLVGAPDIIYMQLGTTALFTQVDIGARAIRAMIDLLGVEGLPLSHQEIAQRHIGAFSFHLPSEEDSGTTKFSVSWDKKVSSWTLETPKAPETTKTVSDLETAVSVAKEWTTQMDAQIEQTKPAEKG